MTETPAIILEAVRRTDIEAVAKVKFTGGSTRMGPCPLCMKGVAKGTCFKIRDKVRWHCHRCGQGGDVVALEALLAGVGQVEAARRLLGGDWRERTSEPTPAQTRRRSESAEAEAARKAGYAATIWRGGGAFAGSPAEAYMAGRGIVPEVLAAMAPNLRFNPRARWFWDPALRRWQTAPAMVALVVVAGPDGRPVATGGVHGTYLAGDGAGGWVKARDPRANAKVMWGPQGLDGRPGGTWIIGPSLLGRDRRPFGISRPDAPDVWDFEPGGAVGAEGIETAASLASLSFLRHGIVPRAFAALSLDRLQGRLATDDERRVDLNTLAAVPGSAFTWPRLDDVEIGVDRDMGPLTFKGRSRRGRPCDIQLDGEGRATLCARMAVAAWREAGTRRVHAVAPPPGCDFNDELGRVLKRRAQAGGDRAVADSHPKVRAA